MDKKLIIEIDGDLYDEFLSMSYTLKVEGGKEELWIPLYPNQNIQNYLLDILTFCGISFKKLLSISNYDDENAKERYLKEHHNKLIKSTYKLNPLLIKLQGNIILSNAQDSNPNTPLGLWRHDENDPELHKRWEKCLVNRWKSKEFTIYLDDEDDATGEEVVEKLCNILSAVNVPFNKCKTNENNILETKVIDENKPVGNVVKLSLLFIYNKLEDEGFEGVIEDFNDGLEIATKSIAMFLDDINEEFGGNILDNVIFKGKSGNLLKFPDDFTNDEWDFENEQLYVLLKKEIDPDIMNQKFLNLSEYGFYADFMAGDDIICQGYDYGEYDTGYYNPYGDINGYILNENSDEYDQAKSILQNLFTENK